MPERGVTRQHAHAKVCNYILDDVQLHVVRLLTYMYLRFTEKLAFVMFIRVGISIGLFLTRRCYKKEAGSHILFYGWQQFNDVFCISWLRFQNCNTCRIQIKFIICCSDVTFFISAQIAVYLSFWRAVPLHTIQHYMATQRQYCVTPVLPQTLTS